MTTPQVTVITAAYNASNFLQETIDCIQSQTFTDWEYLIVDDASEDETPDIIDRARKIDCRIQLLQRSIRGGPFAAANDALREAQAEYIVRIDADDLSPSHRIEYQLQFLQNHPQYRACISPWQSFNKSGFIPGSISQIPTRPRGLKWYLMLRPFASHSSLCIEKSALRDLGGYHELVAAQDYRLLAKLSRRNWVGINSVVLSFVRRHESRISKTSGSIQRELGLQIMEEHNIKITDQCFSRDELNELLSVSQGLPLPVDRGRILLEQWRSIWQHAPELDSMDRKDLLRLYDYHLVRFFHSNLRTQIKKILSLYIKHPNHFVASFPHFRKILQHRILNRYQKE